MHSEKIAHFVMFIQRALFFQSALYVTERLLRFEGSFLNLVLYVCIVLEIDISIFFSLPYRIV